MPLYVLEIAALVWGHPATWATLAVLVSLAFGVWVRRQLSAIGVLELEDRMHWSRALTATATLLAGTLLEGLVARAFGLSEVATWLGMAFGRGLSLLPALLVLAGASWYATSRRGSQRDVSPSVAAELRWVQLGAGLLAAMSVVNAPMVPFLLILGAVGFGWWYQSTPGAKEKMRAWSQDWTAGNRLRSQLDTDATVDLDGENVSVIGKAGLLETDVLTDDGVQTVPNRRLMQAAAAKRSRT